MGKRQSTAFKLNAVEKVLQRDEGQTVEAVAKGMGIGFSTLTRWMSQVAAGRLTASSSMGEPGQPPQTWTVEQKWQALVDTARLGEPELGVYCRQQGIYTHHLHQWKQDFMRSKAETSDTLTSQNRALKAENKQLQRELARKDKALAEAAALLILQKKVQALFGEDEGK